MSEFFPPVSYYFSVKVNDTQVSFQEVTGLEIEKEVEEVPAGGEIYPYRVPGKTKFQNLVLKRGLAYKDSNLINWLNQTLQSDYNSNIETRSILVELLEPVSGGNSGSGRSKPILSWNIVGAYPIKWSFSNLHSEESKIMIETLELAFHYLKIEK